MQTALDLHKLLLGWKANQPLELFGAGDAPAWLRYVEVRAGALDAASVRAATHVRWGFSMESALEKLELSKSEAKALVLGKARISYNAHWERTQYLPCMLLRLQLHACKYASAWRLCTEVSPPWQVYGGEKAPPMWTSPPFQAEFCDPFLQVRDAMDIGLHMATIICLPLLRGVHTALPMLFRTFTLRLLLLAGHRARRAAGVPHLAARARARNAGA